MTDEIFKKEYTYDEVFENLQKSGEDCVKIFSIVNIENIKNKEDFKILINHLTNHSDIIREAAAFKLEEISDKIQDLFLSDFSKEKILDSITDINPNISRAICSIIEKNDKIKTLIIDDLYKKASDIIVEIKTIMSLNKQKNKKSHAKNKKVFAFYWLLEAISRCGTVKNNSEVLEIVNFAIGFPDYTIREKGAKILTKMSNPPSKLLQKAKSDQNFYVKNLLYDRISSSE